MDEKLILNNKMKILKDKAGPSKKKKKNWNIEIILLFQILKWTLGWPYKYWINQAKDHYRRAALLPFQKLGFNMQWAEVRISSGNFYFPRRFLVMLILQILILHNQSTSLICHVSNTSRKGQLGSEFESTSSTRNNSLNT